MVRQVDGNVTSHYQIRAWTGKVSQRATIRPYARKPPEDAQRALLRAGEFREREEAAFRGARADRVGGEARFFVAAWTAALLCSAARRLASVGARLPAAGRLLCQKLVLSPISSTFFPETTDCGASSVT